MQSAQQFGEILGIGLPELVVILVIVLLLFGSKRLPELAKSIGQSVGEIRKGVEDGGESKKNSRTE
jgi:sec-independent protein translocase protein TatA